MNQTIKELEDKVKKIKDCETKSMILEDIKNKKQSKFIKK